jgi:hypothetical protein
MTADYSLLHNLIALAAITLVCVGGPLFALWWDNRKPRPTRLPPPPSDKTP